MCMQLKPRCLACVCDVFCVSLREGGLGRTGSPQVSKPERNLCNFYPVRWDCFAPAELRHIFANTLAREYCSGVLRWDVSVKITPHCRSQTLPESKQRALDVLLEAGHFIWRFGPTFCRTQITGLSVMGRTFTTSPPTTETFSVPALRK